VRHFDIAHFAEIHQSLPTSEVCTSVPFTDACLVSRSLPDYGPTALFLRWQKMDNESVVKEERTAMNAAAADLLAVKLHKPGWPCLKP